MAAAGVTYRTGARGPSGGKGELTGQFFGNKLLFSLGFYRAAI